MATAKEFQTKLEALKTEQTELINSGNRRKKVVRERIQAITKEFYATKKEWKETLGATEIV